MIFFAGFAISSLVVPSWGDIYGRKKVFVSCIFANGACFLILCGLPAHKSSSITFMLISFFIQGLASGGRTSIGYCYFVEIAPSKYADYLGTAWNVSEGIIYTWLTIYYMTISKNTLNIIIFATALQFITLGLILAFVPESPTWLYKQNRVKECQRVCRYMGKMNGKTFGEDSCLKVPIHEHSKQMDAIQTPTSTVQSQIQADKAEKNSPWSMIRNDSTIFVNLVCMTCVWLAASFCYYLISYQLKYIKGDIFVNGIVSSLSECCAYALSGVFMKAVGIKNQLLVSYALAILGMVCLIVV